MDGVRKIRNKVSLCTIFYIAGGNFIFTRFPTFKPSYNYVLDIQRTRIGFQNQISKRKKKTFY